MKIFPKLFLLGLFLVFLFVAVTQAVGGELIKPTRILQSSEKTPGNISVFSEPPGLDVFLNHSKIGKTPILSMEVTPGPHTLKVEDAETEIYVIPGKPHRLSLFKGTFIEVKEKEKEAIQKPKTDTAEKKPAEPTQEKTGYQPKYDPAYWPLKPGGPIK
ncbi:MAG TPA: PEGA domain-containing protein [Desulfobacterales bacterium]|nr:PEGA domain-containing protein [Desulfobacterales bacterium]